MKEVGSFKRKMKMRKEVAEKAYFKQNVLNKLKQNNSNKEKSRGKNYRGNAIQFLFTFIFSIL